MLYASEIKALHETDIPSGLAFYSTVFVFPGLFLIDCVASFR